MIDKYTGREIVSPADKRLADSPMRAFIRLLLMDESNRVAPQETKLDTAICGLELRVQETRSSLSHFVKQSTSNFRQGVQFLRTTWLLSLLFLGKGSSLMFHRCRRWVVQRRVKQNGSYKSS